MIEPENLRERSYLRMLEAEVVMAYDINVWCEFEESDAEKQLSLSFYPLMAQNGFLVVDTSVDYTLVLPQRPLTVQYREAVDYLVALVNVDDAYHPLYTDWWSNQVKLEDAPLLIQLFMKSLSPRSVPVV